MSTEVTERRNKHAMTSTQAQTPKDRASAIQTPHRVWVVEFRRRYSSNDGMKTQERHSPRSVSRRVRSAHVCNAVQGIVQKATQHRYCPTNVDQDAGRYSPRSCAILKIRRLCVEYLSFTSPPKRTSSLQSHGPNVECLVLLTSHKICVA